MRSLVFLVLLFGFSIAGLLLDELFASFKGFIVPLLVLIMLSMGLTLSPEDFRRILREPKIILYGAFLQFTLMPVLGFLIARAFGFDRDLLAGFVLVGSAPGGTASNLITYISGGDLSYSISMTTLSTLLAPVFTPLWTWLLAGKFVSVPFVDMALTTLRIVVAPVVTGMLLRALLKKHVKRVEPALPYVAVLSISFIIGVIFALNKGRLAEVSFGVFAGVLLHNVLGFTLGFAFGKVAGLNNRLAKTLSIEVGMQNSGLSTVLALKFFSSLSALPSAVFSLSQNIVGVLLSGLFRRI